MSDELRLRLGKEASELRVLRVEVWPGSTTSWCKSTDTEGVLLRKFVKFTNSICKCKRQGSGNVSLAHHSRASSSSRYVFTQESPMITSHFRISPLLGSTCEVFFHSK